LQGTHLFIAETEKELSLAVGDCIVVRKVTWLFLLTVAIAFRSILLTDRSPMCI
jgi:hypothetical protein